MTKLKHLIIWKELDDGNVIKEYIFSSNITQMHFLDLPFPKRETAMGTVEAR